MDNSSEGSLLPSLLPSLIKTGNYSTVQNQELLRFLQWAEYDIEDEQILRNQRLRAEALSPHGSLNELVTQRQDAPPPPAS
jgi:hypothetical protein